jgi:biopolymer transport protein ExbD
MRRIAQHSEAEEASIDITPLIDIVFIMLIFFIVTATFVKETGLDVNKPDIPLQQNQNNENENILIRIDGNDGIWLGPRRIDMRSVRPNIERMYAENPDASVVIQAAKSSTNEIMVKIMDAARQVDRNINIAMAEARE